MGSRACWPVEYVKALHIYMSVMLVLSLEKTLTVTVEASDIVNQN